MHSVGYSYVHCGSDWRDLIGARKVENIRIVFIWLDGPVI